MTFQHVLFVALGGAVGAVGRYGLMSFIGAMIGHGYPVATMAVNVIGSLVLGGFIEVSALIWSPSADVRAMIVVGVLGAFTTFSAFSLDAVNLLTHGRAGAAIAYVLLSVVLSVTALWAGIVGTRYLIT